MQYITSEQEQLINSQNNAEKRKRPHVAENRPDLNLAMPETLQRRDVDNRDISTVLSIGEFVKSRNYRVKGPVITRMMVEFFHEYLEKNANIKRVAVIGFNAGSFAPFILRNRPHNRNLPHCSQRHPRRRIRPTPLSLCQLLRAHALRKIRRPLYPHRGQNEKRNRSLCRLFR